MLLKQTAAAESIRLGLLAGAATIALSLPAAALAQSDPDGDAAADDATPTFNDNVIVVTATKREQTLQETPISVSVTSGETLERAQIRDLIDLQSVTPSLRVSQLQSSSNTTFIIRGFGNGDNNFGIEPSVGVFIDGVFRSRSAGSLGDLANVQRIEVLRGPQSTLFGKNASAGVISVITREPQFTFGGKVEASYGNYNSIVVKGDVTGPIGENVAFALDGSYNKRDGYARIVNLDKDLSDRNRWSARGQLLFEPTPDLKIRAIADYSRIDEVCCTVGNVLAGPTAAILPFVGGAIDANNLFSYDTYLNQEPINKIDNYGGSIQVDWNTGPLTVTSISAYRKLKNFFNQDVDFTSADIVSEFRRQNVKSLTQELRVASDFDGPVNFLLGGFYFDESIDQASQLTTGTVARPFFDLLASAAGGTFPPQLGTFSFVEGALGLPQNSIFSPGLLTSEDFSMDNKSWSIFGTVDFEPVEGLVLTAGFNYTDDKKDFALSQTSFDPLANINMVDAFIAGAIGSADPAVIAAFAQSNPAVFAQIAGLATDPASNPLLGLQPFQFQPPFLNLPNAVEDGRTRDDDWSYTLRAAYDVSDRVNVYVSYATGFKASSINLSRDSRPAFGDYIPGPFGSTILAPSSPIRDAGLAVPNLSTGSRFAGPEEAKVWEVGLKAQFPGVGFNLALFDQTLKGFQSFTFTGTGFQLANAGKQSTKGFEFDTTISPIDPLVFTFAATYLDAVYDSFTGSPVGDLSGQRPGGIPEWALSTSATYTHEFGASGNRLITRVDYSHESNTPINNGLPTFNASLGNTQIFSREVNLVNGSMTLALNNGLEIGVWGRNLFNDKYILTIFDGVAQAGTISGYPSVPRTYGGVVRFKF
ncbi:TonB-dependent receptor [Altererythrobacter sp.]|uniref:TonB-dependent receptor n=1 Tax=Altererythrobacter sp. TaxID=1872480 RepID=UPI003D07A7CC